MGTCHQGLPVVLWPCPYAPQRCCPDSSPRPLLSGCSQSEQGRSQTRRSLEGQVKSPQFPGRTTGTQKGSLSEGPGEFQDRPHAGTHALSPGPGLNAGFVLVYSGGRICTLSSRKPPRRHRVGVGWGGYRESSTTAGRMGEEWDHLPCLNRRVIRWNPSHPKKTV